MFYVTFLIQNAKQEAAGVVAQLQVAESEVNALRTMTHRMILTPKEMVCFHVFSSLHIIIVRFK